MICRQGNFIKRIVALLLILLFALSCSPVAFAQEAETEDTINGVPVASGSAEDAQYITARFNEYNSGKMYDLSVPYSDSYFTRADTVFYQDLAQASYGMTLSAFRDGLDPEAAADANVRSFFTQAGFESFQSYGYDTPPTESSFSCAIASKVIDGATVVAFIGCGGGYKAEWISNLTIGSGVDHEGFSASADLCEERLTDYLEENNISGELLLWISGFSRASAVGNLLAARMTEAGPFSAVYGYFFATPNNTKKPIAYDNIFNVIGQNDPVPQIPLTAWGFGRNGKDLYTPAQESNSGYIAAARKANPVMHETSGISFRNNPDLNYQLHVVFEYLGAIFPTSDDYTAILQPQLISAYRNHSEHELLLLLREALANIKDFDPQQQSAVDALMDYLDEVIYQYISGNEQQTADGSWNSDLTLGYNVALEHVMATYLSWLFSTDNPAELYTASTETIRLVIDGSFDLEVWDENGIVQNITSKNEESVYVPGGERRQEDADLVYLYESNHDGAAVINLPCDRDYTLRLNLIKSGTVSLFSDRYSYGDKTNNVSDLFIFSAEKGDVILLQDFLSPDGLQILFEDGSPVASIRQTLGSDTESITARESLMKNAHSMRDLMALSVYLLFTPLLLLLVIFILFLLGRKTGKGRTGITVCLGLLALIFASGAVWIMRVLPNIRSAPITLAVLAAATLLLILIRALIARRKAG